MGASPRTANPHEHRQPRLLERGVAQGAWTESRIDRVNGLLAIPRSGFRYYPPFRILVARRECGDVRHAETSRNPGPEKAPAFARPEKRIDASKGVAEEPHRPKGRIAPLRRIAGSCRHKWPDPSQLLFRARRESGNHNEFSGCSRPASDFAIADTRQERNRQFVAPGRAPCCASWSVRDREHGQ